MDENLSWRLSCWKGIFLCARFSLPTGVKMTHLSATMEGTLSWWFKNKCTWRNLYKTIFIWEAMLVSRYCSNSIWRVGMTWKCEVQFYSWNTLDSKETLILSSSTVLHNWRYLKSSQVTALHAWGKENLKWIFTLLFNVAGMLRLHNFTS